MEQRDDLRDIPGGDRPGGTGHGERVEADIQTPRTDAGFAGYPRSAGNPGSAESSPPAEPVDREPVRFEEAADRHRTLQLREEQLVARKELLEVGEVVLRTELDEVPARLDVEAYREEVEVEHEPIGKVVTERTVPWEEEGALVVPIYEEQLVVVKRLVLREQLRIRRVRTTEHQVFEDTLRRERLVVEDASGSGLVHDRYPLVEDDGEPSSDSQPGHPGEREEKGFLGNLMRRALQ